MKAAYPFMMFPHDIVCMLAIQAFEQGCCHPLLNTSPLRMTQQLAFCFSHRTSFSSSGNTPQIRKFLQGVIQSSSSSSSTIISSLSMVGVYSTSWLIILRCSVFLVLASLESKSSLVLLSLCMQYISKQSKLLMKVLAIWQYLMKVLPSSSSSLSNQRAKRLRVSCCKAYEHKGRVVLVFFRSCKGIYKDSENLKWIA